MTTISSISSGVSPGISSIAPTSSVSATDPTAQVTGTDSATSTQLSPMGELMSRLQSLASSDPAKAKTVLASVAGDLKSKAADSNDPHLAAVADKFSQASQTGDLSVLQPPQGAQGQHHHGGHHHHHASSGNAQQSYDQSAASPVSDVESALESALGDAGA